MPSTLCLPYSSRPIMHVMNIIDVQKLCYPPELHEDPDFLVSLFYACRDTSQIVMSKHYNVVKGYAIAHYLSDPQHIPDLGTFDGVKTSLATSNDVLYIHDLCVNPAFQKTGVATMMVNHIKQIPCSKILGTAIKGSHGFWHKMGASFTGETKYYGDVFELSK